MTAARLFLVLLLLVTLFAIRCQRTATSVADSTTAVTDAPDPTRAEVQASPSPARIVDKTFDDIKFTMPENGVFQLSLLTPEIEELFGQRIRIRGYIYPTPRKRGLKQFVLVRDNRECCFGPGAALFDCIMVEMQEGKTAEYEVRCVAVEGTFRLQVEDFDGTVVAIYRLEGETVE